MKKFVFLLFTIYYLIFTIAPAGALSMSNNNYVLQTDINMSSGQTTDKSYKLDFTAGQTAPGLYVGKNYTVRAGFQYLRVTARFIFSISPTLIDFGTLSPTNPVIRTTTLTVTNGAAAGFVVSAFENHPLRATPSDAFIPDTTCDNGGCNESTSAPWNSSLTYGFGYRCDNLTGTPCLRDFLPPRNAYYFKQFADNSKSESPKAVMSGASKRKTAKAQITYKINVSASQPAGIYNNVITYIATPTF